MQRPDPFQPLLTLAQQISPALQSMPGPLSSPALTPGCDNRASLRQLYDSLRQQYPEAGKPYWMTRGWTLVCWQPLYLALLSVYGLQQIPASLDRLSQQLSPGLVAGFHLPPASLIHATHHDLLDQSTALLRSLLDELASQFCDANGPPLRQSQRLLADQLLAIMVRLQALKPDLSLSQLRHEAGHWLDGLQLPVDGIQRLQLHPEGDGLIYWRHGCCMHYRRDDGELCDNCPRLSRRSGQAAAA